VALHNESIGHFFCLSPMKFQSRQETSNECGGECGRKCDLLCEFSVEWALFLLLLLLLLSPQLQQLVKRDGSSPG
jgi:hypothetical protein